MACPDLFFVHDGGGRVRPPLKRGTAGVERDVGSVLPTDPSGREHLMGEADALEAVRPLKAGPFPVPDEAGRQH